MRLRELLEKKLEINKTEKDISGIINNPKLKPIGAGWQSIAYAHTNHPNMIAKTINIHGDNDPVFQFIRVAKNNSSNPYFPKIFKIKRYNSSDLDTDERDEQMLDIAPKEFTPERRDEMLFCTMERLQETDSINSDELFKLMSSIGINIQFEKKNPSEVLSNLFSDAVSRKRIRNNTTDNNLKQAMRLMEPLFNKYHPDLHLKNIMLRKTQNGYHMVFIDPLSDLFPED
jgi:hypothetical protein